VDPAALVAGLRWRERAAPGARPHVVAAMIATADGRAAIAGKSVALGHPQDRALLRGLRAEADGVLVGTPTIRAERYANPLDEDQRAARAAAGRSRLPLIATVTRSGDVPWDVGLFADPDVHVVIFTAVPLEIPPGCAATVDVERHTAGLPHVVARLGEAYGVRALLSEGGPRLLGALAAEGLVDELFLTVAPLLAAGDAPTPLHGPPLDPPARLALHDVQRADDHLFLHYLASR